MADPVSGDGPTDGGPADGVAPDGVAPAPAVRADYDRFVAESSVALLRLAFARTGDWADAEDLVQDAFADAYRRWDSIGRYDEPAIWARRVVLNRSVSRWRRRSNERRAMDRLAGRPPAAVSNGPRLADDELWQAIRSLPDRQRDVVLLRWFEDQPVATVAETLGCGEETVRTHWRRARATLAERLGETDGSEATP